MKCLQPASDLPLSAAAASGDCVMLIPSPIRPIANEALESLAVIFGVATDRVPIYQFYRAHRATLGVKYRRPSPGERSGAFRSTARFMGLGDWRIVLAQVTIPVVPPASRGCAGPASRP